MKKIATWDLRMSGPWELGDLGSGDLDLRKYGLGDSRSRALSNFGTREPTWTRETTLGDKDDRWDELENKDDGWDELGNKDDGFAL